MTGRRRGGAASGGPQRGCSVDETRQSARFASQTRYQDLPPDLVALVEIYTPRLPRGRTGRQPAAVGADCHRARARVGGPQGGIRVLPVVEYGRLAGGAAQRHHDRGVEIEHIGHSAHASGTAFPPALAVAERDHRDGLGADHRHDGRLRGRVPDWSGADRVGRRRRAPVFITPARTARLGPRPRSAACSGLTRRGWRGRSASPGRAGAGSPSSSGKELITKRIHLGRGLPARVGKCAPRGARIYRAHYCPIRSLNGNFHAFSPRPAVDKVLLGSDR